MNKPTFLFTLGLAVLIHLGAQAQGTIQLANTAATRILIRGYPDGVIRDCSVSDGIVVGVFYGPANSSGDQLLLALPLVSVGGNSGLINTPFVYGLVGTEAGQVVSLQIRAWYGAFGTDWQAARNSGYYYAETMVRQVTLGPTAGPGTVIWQPANGTDPNRFTPIPTIVGVPEPSTFALGALGALALLSQIRKSRNR